MGLDGPGPARAQRLVQRTLETGAVPSTTETNHVGQHTSKDETGATHPLFHPRDRRPGAEPMEDALTLQADGARLEARVGLVPGARAGLVVCHPHPLYGGDMDNPVVVRAAEVGRETGLSTLRFNFRGTGRSTGSHGGGTAEMADVQAGLAALAEGLPGGAPVGLAGYSFGAWVAARVAAEDPRPLGLIAP